MKKIFLTLFLAFIVLVVGFFMAKNSSRKAMLGDDNYIRTLTRGHLKPGMSFQEVEHYFSKLRVKLSLWECADKDLKMMNVLGKKHSSQ